MTELMPSASISTAATRANSSYIRAVSLSARSFCMAARSRLPGANRPSRLAVTSSYPPASARKAAPAAMTLSSAACVSSCSLPLLPYWPDLSKLSFIAAAALSNVTWLICDAGSACRALAAISTAGSLVVTASIM
ncbi:MAG: hypothetical protein WDN06_03615 [Asticcacaulis sp.]